MLSILDGLANVTCFKSTLLQVEWMEGKTLTNFKPIHKILSFLICSFIKFIYRSYQHASLPEKAINTAFESTLEVDTLNLYTLHIIQ